PPVPVFQSLSLHDALPISLTRLNSSCPPLGLSAEEICELASAELSPGDVLVFYTDGVTEAGNRLDEEFGMERLSAAVRSSSSLSDRKSTRLNSSHLGTSYA